MQPFTPFAKDDRTGLTKSGNGPRGTLHQQQLRVPDEPVQKFLLARSRWDAHL
jgi:hypothetical protein